jgi:GNAT superfamily N-acetyltransferase
MTPAGLDELDGPAFTRRLDAFLAVYADAMRPPPEQLPGRRQIMLRHASYDGFRCLAVSDQGRRVAFAYGFPGRSGQWWHDVVEVALTASSGQRFATAWVADGFEIGEVHVATDHQGRGIGRSMVTTLCAGRLERTALLSTRDAATPARHLYRSLGFADLLTAYRFPGSHEPYAIMGAALPLAGA